MPKKISVVMVVYNQREFVSAAIRSIFNQDYAGNFELIISDDASTDGCQAIISEIVKEAPSRIDVKVVFGRIRKGAFRNFSKVLRLASGDFIVVADGDDVSLPHRISEGVNYLVHTGVSACGSSRLSSKRHGVVNIDGDNVDRPIFRLGDNTEGYLEEQAPNIVGASFVFCKSILKIFGSIDSVLVNNHNADHAIFWRAAASHGYRDLPSVAVVYNTKSAGITLRRKEEYFRAQNDWVNTLDIHCRRVLNKIGNKLEASDVFVQAGFFAHAYAARVAARKIAFGLVGLLNEMSRAKVWCCCPELFSEEKINYVLSRVPCFLRFFDRILSEPTKRTKEVAPLDLVLLFVQMAELGVLKVFLPTFDFFSLGDDQKYNKFGLLRIVASIRKLTFGAKSNQFVLSEDAVLVIRNILVPVLENGCIVYRGAVFDFNWNNFRALPKVDFVYLASSLSGYKLSSIEKYAFSRGYGKSEILIRILGISGLMFFSGFSFSDRSSIFLSAAKFKLFRFFRGRSIL